MFGRLPCPDIELPSNPELDWGLKDELKVKIELSAEVIKVGKTEGFPVGQKEDRTDQDNTGN